MNFAFTSVDGLYSVGSWKASGTAATSGTSPSSHHAAALALMQSSKSLLCFPFVRPARFVAN